MNRQFCSWKEKKCHLFWMLFSPISSDNVKQKRKLLISGCDYYSLRKKNLFLTLLVASVNFVLKLLTIVPWVEYWSSLLSSYNTKTKQYTIKVLESCSIYITSSLILSTAAFSAAAAAERSSRCFLRICFRFSTSCRNGRWWNMFMWSIQSPFFRFVVTPHKLHLLFPSSKK